MRDWLKSVSKKKYVNNTVLLVLFIVASAPQATGVVIHEWISFLFLIPFLIHLLLSWDWISSVPKKIFGKLKGDIRFNVVWDCTIYLMMVFVTISGILVSEAALPDIGIPIEPDSFWFEMHHFSSNLLMPMLGIHLAMHWPWIKSMTRKMFSPKTKPQQKLGAKQ